MDIQFKNRPCKSTRVTSPFGSRWGSFHDGIDIGALTPGVDGDELYAVADGTVIISKVNGGGVKVGYGNYIVIQHDGFCTLYGHMQKLGLPVGTKVKAGDVIGYMGNTGSSTGTHVHFRVAKCNYGSDFFNKDSNGITMGSVDPEPYLNNINIKQNDCILDQNDANKIIKLLSSLYYFVQSNQDKDEVHRLANQLRKASGQDTVD